MLDAAALTEARKIAAQKLLSRVNALLPSLEMPEFSVSANITSATDSSDSEGGVVLNPLKSGICSDGWDIVALSVMQNEPASRGNVQISNHRDASSLSSGESARLSLAIESCSLIGCGGVEDKQDQGNFNYSYSFGLDHTPPFSGSSSSTIRGERIIIYDEIDAHVGGEAAVAVARLLKQQGLKRQVIAITHNPVIAAAADQHFVVSRCEDDSYGTSEVSERTGTRKINAGGTRSAEGSVVKEVHGKERELELTRMTTGKLDTGAGADLARELLQEFNGNTY